jgi:hypothetical protein
MQELSVIIKQKQYAKQVLHAMSHAGHVTPSAVY